MLQPWLAAFPGTVKPLMDELDEVLQVPLTKIIEEGSMTRLNHTENSQPAIMATSVIVLRVLEKEFGLNVADRVDYVLGHSLGEFAALVAGGYLVYQDSLRMVRTRGEVMAKLTATAKEEEGEMGMIALVCEADRLESMTEAIHEFLGYGSSGSKSDSSQDIPSVQQVSIANINSKNQVVLSGPLRRIKTLLTHLREFGGHDPRAVLLKSESPFHSPIMQPASDAMRQWLYREREGKTDIVQWPGVAPCISNVSARPFGSKDELKDLLARSCTETVLWWDSIKYLDQEMKVRRWIGIGPGKVGRNLVGKEVGMKGPVRGGGVWGVTDPREAEEAIKGLEETDMVAED